MATRDELDEAQALYEEAVAMYEAAKAEFDALNKAFRDRICVGDLPTEADLTEEERTRARLFFTRVQLIAALAAELALAR